MSVEQTFVLDGPTSFFFPFPVRTAGEVVVAVRPGGILPPSEYQVIGASATASGITVRYPNAPSDGSLLVITRQTELERVSTFLDDLSITARALNAEFDNLYRLIEDGLLNEFRGDWEPSTTYLSKDLVFGPDGNIYIGMELHTSLSFGVDLAAGRWRILLDLSSVNAAVELAQAWAANPPGEEVEGGLFSARHYADVADALLAPAQPLIDNSNALVMLANDLSGTGFGFDLGSITAQATGVPNTPPGYILTVAGAITEIEAVADNLALITDVEAALPTISAVAADLSDITAVAADLTDINNVAADLSEIVTVAASLQDITSVALNISDVGTVADNIGAIGTVIDNLAAIQNAPAAATDAATARDKAQQWAQEDEDVEVEAGQFSAFHWAQKAQAATGDVALLAGGNAFVGNQTVDGNVTITGTVDCGSIA